MEKRERAKDKVTAGGKLAFKARYARMQSNL